MGTILVIPVAQMTCDGPNQGNVVDVENTPALKVSTRLKPIELRLTLGY